MGTWANISGFVQGGGRGPTEDAPQESPRNPDPQYGSKVPCRGSRVGEFKKVPSDNHHDAMKHHVRACGRADCQHVWKGPWGSFIGGARGSTHFDLTECADGKRLNELAGWDYDDPRR